MQNDPYKMYICLPYLYLTEENPLGLGPIRFYPSSKFDDYVSQDEQKEIEEYLRESPSINKGTSICVHPDIREESIPELLIDAVYVLYFAATYEKLYHNYEPPRFGPLTQIVPASESVVKNPANRESLKSLDLKESHILEISIQDDVMLKAMGEVLNGAFLEDHKLDQVECRRIIRSIRYFIHCFHDKFRDLLGSGFLMGHKHFEPEDFLFLVTAFETLFNINPEIPNSDFKQKLRPIIHLKFGKPLEIIWKWIDGFYAIKNEVVHEGTLPDGTFRENHNFEVPYISFAIKLFIYSIYHKLFKMDLLPAHVTESYRPIAFHGIEREEVILFLWPEKELLKKISILIMQLTHGKVTDETVADVSMLAHVYQHMLRYHKSLQDPIKFIPTSKEELKKVVVAIENLSDDDFEYEGKKVHVQELMPEGFLDVLNRRVA
ncbi:MAG: hypothetical protein K940chlam3_00603 [Chlamydiae bacterium]|nr:hypothetical protein [Chlamydiota bacterium]